MAQVQLGGPLTDPEVADIIAFLESLTGPLPPDFATAPVLPAGGLPASTAGR
jgi:cytochrome c peroxidase